jgi:hypothetical protein
MKIRVKTSKLSFFHLNAALCVSLSLCFVSGLEAQKKQVKKTKAPPRPQPRRAAPRVNPPAPSNISATRVRQLMENGNYDEALRLLASSNDATSRSLRAAIFEKMGYIHAALAELVASHRLRPNNNILNRAGALAFLLNENRTVSDFNNTTTTGMRLSAAQDSLQSGDLRKAKSQLPSNSAILSMPASPVKAKAIVVASAIHNGVGDYRSALELLSGDFPQTPGVDLAEIRLQRALVLFEIKKFTEALDELKFITRASPTWYRGQSVGAWAAFHVDDYNLALGQLMNLHSPFLAGKFNPEKHLLQSVVLYQLCHYESAARSLERLKKNYGNMNTALNQVSSAARSPDRFYNELKSFVSGALKTEGSATDLAWDGIASQAYVADMSTSIEKLNYEKNQISQKFSARELQSLKTALLSAFQRIESSYKTRLAKYAEVLVEKMQKDIKETNEGALVVDLEINTRLRERLIRAQAPAQRRIDYKKELQKGYEFWPFEGEFWRDETGSYAFATSDVCEEGVR